VTAAAAKYRTPAMGVRFIQIVGIVRFMLNRGLYLVVVLIAKPDRHRIGRGAQSLVGSVR
jgi:hypothetical protein